MGNRVSKLRCWFHSVRVYCPFVCQWIELCCKIVSARLNRVVQNWIVLFNCAGKLSPKYCSRFVSADYIRSAYDYIAAPFALWHCLLKIRLWIWKLLRLETYSRESGALSTRLHVCSNTAQCDSAAGQCITFYCKPLFCAPVHFHYSRGKTVN